MRNQRKRLLCLFFFSGFSALVYEVVWARQLSLIFGTTTHAISSILTIFFAGLALGSWLFGRLIDRSANPLRFYGFLEVGTGLYAAATPWIFKLIGQTQIGLWQRLISSGLEPSYFGFSFLTFLLCLVGLIIPTSLMGGDLPILSKLLVKREEDSGEEIGLLYFINTLGAVVGAFLTGFFLIAAFGGRETIWLAAGVNLAIGLVILWLSRVQGSPSILSQQARDRPGQVQRTILLVFFLTGFAGLALEVLWTRVLILFFGGSVYAFATVLVIFLLGIALGSVLISRLMKWGIIKNYLIWFTCLGLILGLLVVASLPLFDKMPFWLIKIIREARGSFGKVAYWEFLLSFAIMFFPTFLMGGLFPLGVGIYTKGLRRLGQSVGQLYAANTLGGIFGSLVAGFLLIPLVGFEKGIWLMSGFYFFVGLWILFLTEIQKWFKILTFALTALVLLIGVRISPWNKHFLTSGPYANWRYYVNDTSEQAAERMQASELLYYKDGLEATVVVKKSGKQIFLRINGKTDAATGLDMDTQILSGQLPMLLHPHPEDVLVVGLGSGITLGSVQTHPLKTVEAVEIEPAVIEAARYFSEANYSALEDKRLKVVVADGRNYLLMNQKKYDVITSEPSNPYLSGPSKLFTKEYFALVKNRLKEGGLAAQWIQLYTLDAEDLKMVIKTFQSVFPYTTVWDNLSSYDLLLVGSQAPFDFSSALLEEKFAIESVKKDLARIFIQSPKQFLSYLALDDQDAERFTLGAKENTDNHPILEFSAPKTLYQATISTNLEALKDLRPDLGGRFTDFRKKAVLGKMYFTRGENEKAALEYKEALEFDPENGWLKITLGELYLNFGQAEAQKGNGAAAEKNFSQAVELIPDNPRVHFYLAVIYKIQGREEEAKKELQISLDLNPHQPEVERLLMELEK